MSKFQYTDETKNTVNQKLDGNGSRSIPRSHPFWRSLGVQAAEEAGEILAHDYVEPPTLEEAMAAKNAEINKWRDLEEVKSPNIIEVNGIPWDMDIGARSRIKDALASTAKPPFWTDANNKDQSEYDLQSMLDAYVTRGYEIHARQREMKAEISKLSDPVAVASYPVGWAMQILPETGEGEAVASESEPTV